MYKMAVCDIDGTLVDKNGNLSARTVETIKKINDGKGIVTLCTGRNITKAMPIAKKLGLKVPFVCIDGILLYDPVKKCPVMDKNMLKEDIMKIARYGFEKSMYVEVSDGYKYYKFFPTKAHQKYDLYNKHTFFGRIKSYLGGIRYVKSIEEFEKIEGHLYQIALGGEKNECARAKNDLEKMNFKDVEIRDFIMDCFLFINHTGMGKARGVRLLCDFYGISMDEVIAIGDEMNDIDMLEQAGLGVAMGNAPEKVKEYADIVADTNENDGAAKILEKYFLG